MDALAVALDDELADRSAGDAGRRRDPVEEHARVAGTIGVRDRHRPEHAALGVPDGSRSMDERLREILSGEDAWIVGGAVRDALLLRPVLDVDVACADPRDAAHRFARRFGGAAFPLSERHGAWRVVARASRRRSTSPRSRGDRRGPGVARLHVQRHRRGRLDGRAVRPPRRAADLQSGLCERCPSASSSTIRSASCVRCASRTSSAFGWTSAPKRCSAPLPRSSRGRRASASSRSSSVCRRTASSAATTSACSSRSEARSTTGSTLSTTGLPARRRLRRTAARACRSRTS